MQRPPARDFVFGHRTAVWLATVALGLSALACLGPSVSWVSWLVPFGALIARSACVSARQRVSRWRRWTEAWEEMDGVPPAERTVRPSLPRTQAVAAPRPGEPVPAHRNGRMPRSVPIIAWLLLLGYFTARRDETQTAGGGVLALLLIALSMWGVIAAVASLGRRVLRVSTPTAPRAAAPQDAPEPVHDEFVTQCLPGAGNEAPSVPLRDLLPGYARALLARSREPHHSTSSHSNNESEQSS